MGQGQTKASKRRETNGEQGPSPKKEAKKSPKKSKSSSKSSRSSSINSQGQGQSQGQVQIEVRESSPTRVKGRHSGSPSKDTPVKKGSGAERDTVISDDIVKPVDSKQIESPPKPKRTYEVEFIEPEKENVPDDSTDGGLNVSAIKKVESSPTRGNITMNGTSGDPLTPVKAKDLNHVPQATSTPAPNGTISSGRRQSGGPSSDEDHTDVSDDEAFSSEQQFRSASPTTASNVSLKSFSTINSPSLRVKSCLVHALAGICLPGALWFSSLDHTQDSYEKRSGELSFGKFYNVSYLNKPGTHTQQQKPQETKKHNPNQFTRPANFSYSKEPPSFLKNKKSGMMSIAAPAKTVVKTAPRRSSSPAAATGMRRNLEAVRMSTFPGGKRPPAKEIAKIERDDWPAPPSPAAILPEILRQRRKSRGEEDDDEEEQVQEDPKIAREIEELKKIKDESGIGTVICRELEEQKTLPSKLLDPWKASRVPNAAYEPKYNTRYQSPMFASPSRFLDKSRRRAWDDSDIRGYRTMSTIGNWPAPRPGYGLVAPRAATLPVQGIYGGPLEDYLFYGLDSEGHDTRVSMSSINTEASKVTSTIFDHPGVSLMTFQKNSWHTAAKPPVYAYDRLKISNFDLPKDVDRNQLEIHLTNEDFAEIFEMKMEEFSHLPEWKRNDMKRKKDLY